MIVGLSAEDVGADLRQRIKQRDFAARRFLQCLGRRVDLRERAQCFLDGADDGLDMWMALGSGEDGVGVFGQRS